ncbi:MAG TPA: M20/M25/M40 family metallo-hydrolase [Phycisphaerales bacterium]|nr:M20/M25/M40 family metallo-hydrolase [Phycisphaerales bacterium]
MAANTTNDNIDLLKRLCETPGLPGREERVRALIEKEVKGLFDSVVTDALGNLICRRNPRGGSSNNGKPSNAPGKDRPTRVMLLSHMDEIGFYVTHVDSKGWLWMNPAGGFDPRTLFARRVTVVTDNGDLKGVMNPGGRPLHISLPKDREKIPEVKEFYVDIGLPADEVKKKVKVGDYVVPDEPLVEVGNKIVSKALDNRVACWLGIEAVRRLDAAGTGHSCEIVVAFTTQEEVGLRGAKNASFQVQPDIGIGLDVTLSCDTPGVPEEEAVTRNGEGFGLHIKDGSFISDHTLVREFEELAKKKEIPYQRSILAAGGQDGAAAQQSAAGARAIGITVGTRYIHTITEMIDRKDLFAARDILVAYLGQVQ